jgi:N-methylhydantoinase A
VEVGDEPLTERFHRAHDAAYGYAMPTEEVRLVTARVVAEGTPALTEPPRDWSHRAGTESRRSITVDGGRVEARVVPRGNLDPGDALEGPALIEQADTTVLVPPGDRARVDDHHNLVLTTAEGAP